MGNLTGAPGTELVASDIDGNVLVANRGVVEWRATLDGNVWAPPVVRDIDADGTPEAVVGTSSQVVAFEPDGTTAWRADVGATAMTSGQVDDDSAVEFVATEGGRVTVLDGSDGRIQGQWMRRGR